MEWIKSSYCDANSCAEMATDGPDVIYLRNSREPDKMVAFSGDEWRDFIAGARAGEFDVVDN